MENDKAFDLIITVVNRGFADQVVDAAKSAGAQGGTVLKARGTGIHEVEKFFGISIQPEKEVVLTLIRHEFKQDVLYAIAKEAGLNQEGRGLSFSLPVEDVVGIVHADKDLSELQAMRTPKKGKESKRPKEPK